MIIASMEEQARASEESSRALRCQSNENRMVSVSTSGGSVLKNLSPQGENPQEGVSLGGSVLRREYPQEVVFSGGSVFRR